MFQKFPSSNKSTIYCFLGLLSQPKSSPCSYSGIYNINSKLIFPQSFHYQGIGTKIMASSTDGFLYEKAIGASLCQMYPGQVQDEKQIASKLSKYTKGSIDTLRGIDFTICNPKNYRIYALQIKIGARTRGVKDINPFVHTLGIFRKYINSSLLSEYRIIPVWYSSADLELKARDELISSGVHIFMDPEWNLDLNKCRLFTNFISMLKT